VVHAIAGERSGSSCRNPSAADAMAEFVSRLPLPQHLRDVGVRNDELADIARSTLSDYMIANSPKPVSEQEVLALLQQAW